MLRFVAASAVLLSHCWSLTLVGGASEPLYGLIGVSLGTSAVAVFFAISGFLVAASWERSPRVGRFVSARALRIMPGLAVVLILTVVLGTVITTASPSTYIAGAMSYLARNITLWRMQYDLPGVFLDNPYPKVVNGSLWTLFYEVVCYAGLLAAGIAGLLRARLWGFCLLAFVAACVVAGVTFRTGTLTTNLLLLAPPFALGMSVWIWRERISLGLPWVCVLIVAGGAGLHFSIPGALQLYTVSLGLLALWFALVPAGPIRGFNRVGDYSYGMYIYAFPVQQTVVHFAPGIGVAGLFALAFPITLSLAAASWHLVESPALSLRKRVQVTQGNH